MPLPFWLSSSTSSLSSPSSPAAASTLPPPPLETKHACHSAFTSIKECGFVFVIAINKQTWISQIGLPHLDSLRYDEGLGRILCFVDRASLYNLFKMKPARCTLLISTSVHVSGTYVSIIRRSYCIYATLVFFTLYEWLSGLLVCRPDSYPYRVQNTSVA